MPQEPMLTITSVGITLIVSLLTLFFAGRISRRAVVIYALAFLCLMNLPIFLKYPFAVAWDNAVSSAPWYILGWIYGFIPAGIILLLKLGRRRGMF